jgi:Tfp pilus assembly protein PilO
MRLGELSRAHKLLLIFGLASAVVIAAIVWAVKVNRRNIQSLQAARVQAETTYNDTRKLADSLPKLDQELNLLGVKLHYLRSLAWSEPEYMPALVRDLANLAAQDGVSLKAVKPMLGQPPPPPSQDKKTPVASTRKLTIVVSGSYGGVYRFVNDLQRFPVLLAIQDVRVGIGNPEGPVLDATLNTEMSVLPKVEVDIFGIQPEEATVGAGGPSGGPGAGSAPGPAPSHAPEEAPAAAAF